MNVSIDSEDEISNSIHVTMMLIVLISMVCDVFKASVDFGVVISPSCMMHGSIWYVQDVIHLLPISQ